jgi:glutathione peroxidase
MFNLTMKRIDGTEQPLSDYQGSVLLVVNVASRCGLTPQYEALERLYETYRERGFEILGFPANDFMGQEPGTDEEIAEFCSQQYDVQFPLFSKISVKGEGQDPLYQYLTSLPEPLGGDIQWNFQKFLVDREGNVVRRFSPRMTPDDPELVGAIEALL